ncbi:MAG: 4Fe-4S dicluster domain-containing protein [candidate division Zixibacteria bacterium]|nr:4Fe-4S dicluster domain-containing protein [candidate division Zixibacteria bacterium]
MGIKRRDFFKMAAIGSVTIRGSKSLAGEEGPALDFAQALGVLVDAVVCIGCRKCEWACNNEHKLSTRTLAEFEDKSVFAFKVQCMHCNNPACVSACIVGALRKNKIGSVDYDAWKCIGCRYCMVACPFQIPAYEYHEALAPRVRKCTFCEPRLVEGKKPACVALCPNEALTFGTRQELLDVAKERIKLNPEKYFDHVYGETEIGGTSWMYLAPTDFVNTELPKLQTAAIPNLTETIQHGVFKSFVPPLALYGLLGLVMHSLREGKDEEEKHDERD